MKPVFVPMKTSLMVVILYSRLFSQHANFLDFSNGLTTLEIHSGMLYEV